MNYKHPSRFNSKLVRLKVLDGRLRLGRRIPGFNSKLVRLKVQVMALEGWLATCFNSKLVRLKVPAAGDVNRTHPSWFQFQTGAIKSIHVTFGDMIRCAQFQFQTGAIKSERGARVGWKPHVSIPNWCD